MLSSAPVSSSEAARKLRRLNIEIFCLTGSALGDALEDFDHIPMTYGLTREDLIREVAKAQTKRLEKQKVLPASVVLSKCQGKQLPADGMPLKNTYPESRYFDLGEFGKMMICNWCRCLVFCYTTNCRKGGTHA